ncbi:probable serine/threonine-protein kinase PBL11 [Cornus florida]|uniref:probable serine/threonine-protein kinase PBL11 n=1 Tax=Cornus florida TaxID=4283 RepID=UPI00289F9B02|nr:probable serine/threonine-protein kinase PBL11 [Cornus florida]XP_059631757.1 probable serine/threonine-protein kinase PBL11 [Cornus florida]XP_059631758.1 probable serine/threonine-protein kinase PBL11 [Cornus florida]
MEGERLDLRKCSPEELKDLTDNFSEANLIGETQFGRVFRGKTQQGQDVTVKIWEEGGLLYVGKNENRSQLMAECTFLKEPSVNHHPNLAKLMGYCCEDGLLGVVYDLNPLDTLRNLIVKDSFSWLQRIKVAIGFARVLELLHGQSPEYIVRNIDAAHIMLDQGYNPIVFDFGMLTGGVLGDKSSAPNRLLLGSFGYIDLRIPASGVFMPRTDVFSFGTLLLELISKRVRAKNNEIRLPVHMLLEKNELPCPVHMWAENAYTQQKRKKSIFSFGPSKISLVRESLEKDFGFNQRDGCKITKLAMGCVQKEIHCRGKKVRPRPTMKEVVQILGDLYAVHHHKDVGF